MFHGAVIDPCVRIGKGVIINKKALVGHERAVRRITDVPGSIDCLREGSLIPKWWVVVSDRQEREKRRE